VAVEERVGRHLDSDENVARRSAILAGFALAAQPNFFPRINSGWDLYPLGFGAPVGAAHGNLGFAAEDCGRKGNFKLMFQMLTGFFGMPAGLGAAPLIKVAK
jgi:hypothetical protein